MINGVFVKDQCWFRKKDNGSHIKVAELVVVKRISFADKWSLQELEILTDSSSVFGWLRSNIGHDLKVKTHGLNEMIVQRRLKLLKTCFNECGLNCQSCFILLKKADELTRVTQNWLKSTKFTVLASPSVEKNTIITHKN